MGKKIRGTALVPGVSRNGRLYTRENIEKAYNRLAARIAEGINPVIMRTHHDAGDDSLRIVARVTGVSLGRGGELNYEGTPAETAAGKDIQTLMEGKEHALAHVSVYGSWVGSPRMVKHEGRFVETADDLEIDKIDFTATPGVLSATASLSETVPDGVLAETMRPVRFVDESPLGEAVTDQDTVDISLMGSCGGINVAIAAWCVPAPQIDAYADTIQRALTAALDIASGGPVDDDGDAAGEAIDDNAMETKTPDTEPAVEETRKEPDMADEKPVEGTEAVSETATNEEAKPLTAADVATVVTEVLKAAGVIKVEETTDGGEVAAEVSETKTEPVNVKELAESIRKDVIADLVKDGSIRPQRRGQGLTENTEAHAESSAEAWENRGEDLAAAFADAFPAQD